MPNDPYLDDSVAWRIKSGNVGFHEPDYREVADAILDSGLATEVVQRIGSGKEADVYFAWDNRRPLAVKAYRLYRTSHRDGGSIKLNSMGHQASREFELLGYAWSKDARVPEPYRRIENMFSMQYLGDANGPAPLLQHVLLDEPESFLEGTLEAIRALAAAGIVHSDLSPFNILVHRETPWIIDLASCYRVDRLGRSPWRRLSEASAALNHGLTALARFFKKYGLRFEVEPFVASILERLDRFGVLT